MNYVGPSGLNRFCDRDPDLMVGAITCRRFAPRYLRLTRPEGPL
jgi:hypothetical protein